MHLLNLIIQPYQEKSINNEVSHKVDFSGILLFHLFQHSALVYLHYILLSEWHKVCKIIIFYTSNFEILYTSFF
jgi:hypothetical protein